MFFCVIVYILDCNTTQQCKIYKNRGEKNTLPVATLMLLCCDVAVVGVLGDNN